MAGAYGIIAGPSDGEPDEAWAYDIIPGAPAVPPVRARAQGRRPRQRAPVVVARDGDFVAWFVSHIDVGPPTVAGDGGGDADAHTVVVDGVALCSWSFVEPSEAVETAHADLHGADAWSLRARANPGGTCNTL